MKKLIIVGDGGHSKVVQEVIRSSDYQLIGIWDDKYSTTTRKGEIDYSPIDFNHHFVGDTSVFFFLAIGNNAVRKKLAEKFNLDKRRYAIIIDASAIISAGAAVLEGSLIMAGAIIQTGTKIGSQVIVNTGSIIDHDCHIEEYVHVAPGATITGNCRVQQMSLIGAGSTLIPGVVIGNHVVVGAGSVIVKNISACQTVYGNPAEAT